MDLDRLKDIYKNAGKEEIGKDRLFKMIRAATHPVLSSIKRQLIIESVMWSIFLVVYYDFFDGHTKPFLWNILLVLSVVLILVHNILGYRVTANPIQAESINNSLYLYLKRLRLYALISIATRVIAILMIMGFFISTIEAGRNMFVVLGFVVIIILFQVVMIWKIWKRRINNISEAKKSFEEI